jgi:hypothetical protein
MKTFISLLIYFVIGAALLSASVMLTYGADKVAARRGYRLGEIVNQVVFLGIIGVVCVATGYLVQRLFGGNL